MPKRKVYTKHGPSRQSLCLVPRDDSHIFLSVTLRRRSGAGTVHRVGMFAVDGRYRLLGRCHWTPHDGTSNLLCTGYCHSYHSYSESWCRDRTSLCSWSSVLLGGVSRSRGPSTWSVCFSSKGCNRCSLLLQCVDGEGYLVLPWCASGVWADSSASYLCRVHLGSGVGSGRGRKDVNLCP